MYIHVCIQGMSSLQVWSHTSPPGRCDFWCDLLLSQSLTMTQPYWSSRCSCHTWHALTSSDPSVLTLYFFQNVPSPDIWMAHFIWIKWGHFIQVSDQISCSQKTFSNHWFPKAKPLIRPCNRCPLRSIFCLLVFLHLSYLCVSRNWVCSIPYGSPAPTKCQYFFIFYFFSVLMIEFRTSHMVGYTPSNFYEVLKISDKVNKNGLTVSVR